MSRPVHVGPVHFTFVIDSKIDPDNGVLSIEEEFGDTIDCTMTRRQLETLGKALIALSRFHR